MAKDIIKNIPLTLDINAKKRIEGKVGISLYSKDIATGQFEFTFIDEDGDPVVLDETYSAQALVKYEGNSKTYLNDMIIEGNIIRFIFPHDFITKDGTITMYIYITKDNYTSDVAAISFPVFVSEIDKDLDPSISVHYIGKIEQLIQDMKDEMSSYQVDVDEIIEGYEESISKLQALETDYEPQLTSLTEQLAQTVKKGEVSVSDIDKNLGKFDQTYMSDELLQQMVGDTPINTVPADGSLTTAKLADKAVEYSKTNFIDYEVVSSNYFNKEDAILDTFLTDAGHVPMATYFVSGIFQSPETSSWVAHPCRYLKVYNADGSRNLFTNTGDNLAVKTFEVPAGGWFEFAGPMTRLNSAQVNKGTVLEPFEEYKEPIVLFPELSFTETQKDELLSTAKFGYDQLDFMQMTPPSSNYFDKSTAKIDILLSTASYSDFADYFTSQIITSEDESAWTIYPCRVVRVFDSSGNRIHFNNSGSNHDPQTINVPAGGSFEFSGHISVINTTQVNKGDTVLEYEPFRSSAPTFPELEFTQEQKAELLGNTVIPNPTTETGGLEVIRNGSELQVQSESDGHVLVNNISLTSSANGAFRILSTALDNRTIHSVTDDITPIRTFYTVGANHGYPSQKVTISGHDKETADLGSVWTDGETDFTLIRVDGDTLTFISEYVVMSNGAHAHKSGFSGSTLTHKSGATNTSQLTSVSPSEVQLYPVIKDIQQELNIPSEDGKYNVDEFIVRESYEILDYMALVDWCQSNIGKYYEDNLGEIEAMSKYSTTYTYRNFGKCLVNNSLLYYKKSRVGNVGFLQSGRLNASAMRYMPDIKPIGGHDFKQGVSTDSITSNLIVGDSDLIDVEYPPTRYVDSHENYGYTMGFVPDKLGGIPSVRKANTDQYWDLRNTGKSYPVAFNGLVGYSEPGYYYSIEGYRNYFIKDPDLTLFDEVEDGEAHYVFIDAHKSIPYLTRNVNAKEGSKIEVLKQDGIELVNDYVSSEGITFKVPGEYGQMVLKIYK